MNGSRWESFFGGDEEPGEVSKKKNKPIGGVDCL